MMKIRPLVSTLGLLIPLATLACGDDGGGPNDPIPFRGDWEPVADVEFPYLTNMDGMAVPQIGFIQVGGREFNDNFSNRGDITVKFTGEPAFPTGRIIIEMRKFTSARSQEAANLDFDALQLWAFSAAVGQPMAPDDMDPSTDCTAGAWQDGCGIRVWFSGQVQLQRAGADIRVTLPRNYRHELGVTTEDNTIDDFYQNRGNVCIENLHATATVELESGSAYVTLADDTSPVPICDPQAGGVDGSIENCETFTDAMGGNAAWDNMCDCLGFSNSAFGRLSVLGSNSPADIWVDVPDGLWSSINAQNQADQPQDCPASVTLANFMEDPDTADQTHWVRGSANHPSPAATMGAGFAIQATPEGCGPVFSTEDPEDFVGRGNGDMQATAPGGLMNVCTNCQSPRGQLRGTPCESLLPGG